MPTCRAIVVALLPALALLGPVHATAAQQADAHVRTSVPQLRDLVARGLARSPSLRALLARVEASDLIVYLQYDLRGIGTCGQPKARLLFLARAGGRRYLVVRVRPGEYEWEQLALVGHELRHAVEIADAPEIVDGRTFLCHYQRIGFEAMSAGDGRAFETAAARAAEAAVRHELLAAAAAGPPAADAPRAGARRVR